MNKSKNVLHNKKMPTLMVGSLLAFALSQAAMAELSFKPAQFSIGDVDESQVSFGDINQNGTMDALLSGSGRIFEINGEAQVQLSSMNEFTASTANGGFALVDLNLDGKLDVLSYPLVAYMNDGEGHFGTQGYPMSTNIPYYGELSIEALFIDDNPYPDIFISSARHHAFSEAYLFMNMRYADSPKTGDLAYEEFISLNASFQSQIDGQDVVQNTIGIRAGDVNGDGANDLVLVNGVSSVNRNARSAVLLSDGQGGYLASQLLSNAQDIALADFDGDGDLDIYLARANLQGSALVPDEVWLNDGQGTFVNTGQALAQTETKFAQAVDIDNDGDLDVVAVNENAGATSYSYSHLPQSAKIWLNDGQGNFSDSLIEFGADKTALDLDIVDIDQDGDLDIMTRNKSAQYDIGYISVNSVRLNQNEIWLNTLIDEEDVSSDTSAGIAFCQSTPMACNLYSEQHIYESYTIGYDDAMSSCIADPASCDLFSLVQVTELEEQAFQAGREEGYSEGYSDGYGTGYDVGYSDGLAAGLEQGLAEGTEQGHEQGLAEGIEQGLEQGIEQGSNDMLATCQQTPEECGIEIGAQPVDILALIQAIRNNLPKGQVNSLCKKGGSSPLCWDSVEDVQL